MSRCPALTKSGKGPQCTRILKEGDSYCFQHLECSSSKSPKKSIRKEPKKEKKIKSRDVSPINSRSEGFPSLGLELIPMNKMLPQLVEEDNNQNYEEIVLSNSPICTTQPCPPNFYPPSDALLIYDCGMRWTWYYIEIGNLTAVLNLHHNDSYTWDLMKLFPTKNIKQHPNSSCGYRDSGTMEPSYDTRAGPQEPSSNFEWLRLFLAPYTEGYDPFEYFGIKFYPTL